MYTFPIRRAAYVGRQSIEEEFRKYCQVIIINNGDLEETYRQINKIMGVEV